MAKFYFFNHTRHFLLALLIIYCALAAVFNNITPVYATCWNSYEGPNAFPLDTMLLISSLQNYLKIPACLAIPLLNRKYGYKVSFMITTSIFLISSIGLSILPQYGLWVYAVFSCINIMAYAGTATIIGAFIREWAPLSELGLFCGIGYAAGDIGLILTPEYEGIACELIGWKYLHSALTFVIILVAIAFFALFTDFPRQNPHVSPEELEYILKDKIEEREVERIPYKGIFCDIPMLLTMIVATPVVISDFTYYSLLPEYINQVYHLSVIENSRVLTISPVLSTCIKCLLPFPDMLLKVSDQAKFYLYGGLSFVFFNLGLVMMVFITDSTLWILILSQVFYGIGAGFVDQSFRKAVQIMAAQHIHAVISYSSFANTLIGGSTTLIFSKCFDASPSLEKYRWTFGIATVANFFGMVAQLATFETKPRPFTLQKLDKKPVPHKNNTESTTASTPNDTNDIPYIDNAE